MYENRLRMTFARGRDAASASNLFNDKNNATTVRDKNSDDDEAVAPRQRRVVRLPPRPPSRPSVRPAADRLRPRLAPRARDSRRH